MLARFQNLERVDVYDCGSLQEVFEIQRHEVIDTHAVTVIPLKKLYLRHLLKMKQIWNKDLMEFSAFKIYKYLVFGSVRV